MFVQYTASWFGCTAETVEEEVTLLFTTSLSGVADPSVHHSTVQYLYYVDTAENRRERPTGEHRALPHKLKSCTVPT